MKNKGARLQAIRRLIGKMKISSQEELLKLLNAEGFNMTQATLSRDLHYLKVSKMPDEDNSYIYSLQEKETGNFTEIRTDFPLNGFLSIQFAQGMGLIRTLPGFASGIASAIDTMNIREVAGTIAGDDTILLIPRDGSKKEDIINKLSGFIPGVKSKFF
jgi:transcriptional regulator of arginine metabolism